MSRTLVGPVALPLLRVGAALVALATACGGMSIRHEGGDAGSPGDDDEPPPIGGTTGRGGAPGAGGATAGYPTTGGTTSFGGSSFGGEAGVVATGGVSAGGVSAGGVSAGGASAGGVPTGGVAGTATGGGCSVGSGATGSGDAGASPPSFGSYVPWNQNGILLHGDNAFDIGGNWYSFDDCSTAASVGLPCTQRDQSMRGPDGLFGWQTANNAVCAKGIAPRVVTGPDGMLAYSYQWGFGLGFTLNGGASYDASGHCVVGFAFDIAGPAPPVLRVAFTTTTTATQAHFIDVSIPVSTLVVYFSDVRQGPWVMNPQPFNPRAITNVEFQIFTTTDAPKPFNFCVSNFRAIQVK